MTEDKRRAASQRQKEMADHLDSTALRGRTRAFNVLVNQAYFNGLTFEAARKMGRRELERLKNSGPVTAKIIYDSLRSPVSDGPDASGECGIVGTDAVSQFYRASIRYLESLQGSASAIGGVQIQDHMDGTFHIAVRVTGVLPLFARGAQVSQGRGPTTAAGKTETGEMK